MALTAGWRIYAIGDVHGCADKLAGVQALIEADLAADPHPKPLLVFLGDYVDRGPDSRGVLDRMLAIAAGPLPALFLRGNHEQMLLDALSGPEAAWHFARGFNGGAQTLASYGLSAAGLDAADLPARIAATIPPAHLDFVRATRHAARIGGYIFVHAGLRPGIPLLRQSAEDLLWIREPFLSATAPHEGIVVHGHTPVPDVRHHGNRIELDTGAVFGGQLSCVVLEDNSAFELTGAGRRRLHPPRRG